MAAYPGCIILDPLRAFKGEVDNVALGDLISSGGVSIWKEGDPVHLTQTAYGDIAEQIVNTAAGRGSEDAGAPARKRLESIVTRSAIVQPQRRSQGGYWAETKEGQGGAATCAVPPTEAVGAPGAARQWRGVVVGAAGPHIKLANASESC